MQSSGRGVGITRVAIPLFGSSMHESECPLRFVVGEVTGQTVKCRGLREDYSSKWEGSDWSRKGMYKDCPTIDQIGHIFTTPKSQSHACV